MWLCILTYLGNIITYTIKRTLDCVMPTSSLLIFYVHIYIQLHGCFKVIFNSLVSSQVKQQRTKKKKNKRVKKALTKPCASANFRCQLLILKRGEHIYPFSSFHRSNYKKKKSRDLIFRWTFRCFLPFFLHLFFFMPEHELNEVFNTTDRCIKQIIMVRFKCLLAHMYSWLVQMLQILHIKQAQISTDSYIILNP